MGVIKVGVCFLLINFRRVKNFGLNFGLRIELFVWKLRVIILLFERDLFSLGIGVIL